MLTDNTLTIHDTRRLMLSVMIDDCGIDSLIADSCLNHKVSGTIKHYSDFEEEELVAKAFNKFWAKIREEEEEELTLDDIPEDIKKMVMELKKMKNTSS